MNHLPGEFLLGNDPSGLVWYLSGLFGVDAFNSVIYFDGGATL
jgi:hypothetical protein